MSVPNPEHLFDQANRLASSSSAGAPRQVDLRRAMSSAYYGVFHFAMTSLADEFVGVTDRGSSRYVLVYRSIDHRRLKEVCSDVAKQTPPGKYSQYLPGNGLGANLQAFSSAVVDLQEKRHRADYDPQPRFRIFDAKLAIDAARSAIRRFNRASKERQRVFLTLLLCPPR